MILGHYWNVGSMQARMFSRIFLWIKQHLRGKRFFGASGNAVKTQVWKSIPILKSAWALGDPGKLRGLKICANRAVRARLRWRVASVLEKARFGLQGNKADTGPELRFDAGQAIGLGPLRSVAPPRASSAGARKAMSAGPSGKPSICSRLDRRLVCRVPIILTG